ncbi:MAG: hypothetical protein KAS66_09900 [Candidatus Omnitrophica bacterium]|nr:hypothetical protein [Candidatus Omnitrophota bacterium]
MNFSRIIQILKIKYRFREFFSLANKALHISNRFLDKIENQAFEEIPVGAKRVCIALFIQAIRLLDSAIILCKKGLDEEASILVRSLLENTSYLMFISEKDHEKRAELYMHSRALSEPKVIRQLNSHVPDGEEEIDDKFYLENEQKAIEYFRKEYGKELTIDDIKKKYALRPQNAAEKLSVDVNIKKMFHSTYHMFYPVSSTVTHAEAPLRFLSFQNNQPCFNRWSRGGPTTRLCLQASILFTLYGMDNLSKLLAIDTNVDIDSMTDKLFSFIEGGVNST